MIINPQQHSSPFDNKSLTSESAPPWRQAILQRLHIHSSGKRPRPKLPALDIRPSTALSLPIQSTDSTLDSDAAAIITEIAQIMPGSLSLTGPSHNSNKRSRSCESRNEVPRLAGSGNGTLMPSRVDGKLGLGGVRLPAYLSKSRAEIQAAFDDLEVKQRSRLSGAPSNSNWPFKLDRSTTVSKRNRYGNVQPWENSRVKLDFPIQGSDYINASPIKLESRGRHGGALCQGEDGTGPREMSTYIATQGPKADQISHFWHMVMQQTPSEGGVIIMLTQPHEGLKEKCALYFPVDKDKPSLTITPEPKAKTRQAVPTLDDGEQKHFLHVQGPNVELISLAHDQSIGCEVRQLQLSLGGVSKTIHHYFYGNWADFGKPEAEDRLALLQLMRVSRQMAGDSPRIVHCSAGVGRTGTWIALDFLLRELEEGRLVEPPRPHTSAGSLGQDEKDVSKSDSVVNDVIHDIVDQLRTQRMMMVTNLVQYTFLYEALRELFMERYAEKESGVVSSRTVLAQSIYDGTSLGTVKRDEDTD
ncbi:hypothetical protein DV737_g4525, partial [Chaetothyriales sp. CBS 132003]